MGRLEYTVIASFVLYFCGGMVYSKLETACLQLKKLSCGGHFINKLNTLCTDLGQCNNGDHGKNCSRNEECSIENSVCFAGTCLCRLGLYYSPSINACLKECDEYGDKMDLYKGAGIIGHNEKVFEVNSLARCYEVCVREMSFICLTMDIHDIRVCQLAKVGYLDVKEAEREIGLQTWSLAQRRCK